uniref:Uncharacterized protein n=2 Tax=Attheya septentrionalis TaxID=420275 RepID=A0A7S2UT21_9STRA|mmetsp:Transcript_8329/g.15093  ORF Transcript_8329/g.15093 Transcript_8329/m.15093 type:complete len:517 (+) Transcript_8329:60-1610(+)|eukprot:CAMPEP_0198285912 /NCGR_PEP_ID=MMETSP1449-20131203/5141_1 /TAXON_ID=420275 /ORGANISM="Attheya septentrionalis, Strain CCMP2084" /LENGTH=516 /DNA_ID=CAMNT_0043983525 /DNA_START=37 /DNA_END=1587 /DNA_ORIENTATION=-
MSSQSSDSSSTDVPPTVTALVLKPSGEREVVEEAKALEFVAEWTQQLESHALLHSPDFGDVQTIELVLSDKSYTAEAAKCIAAFLEPLAPRIVRADLSDIIASRMEEEGLQVLETICNSLREANLLEVNLSDNAMGNKGILACAAVLGGQAHSLEALSMCNNGLSEHSMEQIADILTTPILDDDDETTNNGRPCMATRLTKLHFYNNMSGNGGCNAFARILSQCTSELRDLRYSSTRAGREGSLMIASALDGLCPSTADGGGENNKDNGLIYLERLDLADNSFGSEAAVSLSRALARCVHLKYLNLRDCILEDGGTQLVCHALWCNDAPVEHLDLSGNDITKRGAKSLAELMDENPGTLRVLHAEENEMTSIGIRKIARAIYVQEKNTGSSSLVELRLGHNECGKIGASALVDAFGAGGEGMPLLQSIDLDGNGFLPEDVETLEAAFGDKLGPMEDNVDDEDADENLDPDDFDEDEDDDDDDKDSVEHATDQVKTSTDVDAITESIAKGLHIDGLC